MWFFRVCGILTVAFFDIGVVECRPSEFGASFEIPTTIGQLLDKAMSLNRPTGPPGSVKKRTYLALLNYLLDQIDQDRNLWRFGTEMP